jgi:hypothetical protein
LDDPTEGEEGEDAELETPLSQLEVGVREYVHERALTAL